MEHIQYVSQTYNDKRYNMETSPSAHWVCANHQPPSLTSTFSDQVLIMMQAFSAWLPTDFPTNLQKGDIHSQTQQMCIFGSVIRVFKENQDDLLKDRWIEGDGNWHGAEVRGRSAVVVLNAGQAWGTDWLTPPICLCSYVGTTLINACRYYFVFIC